MDDVQRNIEIYKEMGSYERHFNQLQSVYRGLASTWLLATFGAIGYILVKADPATIKNYDLAALCSIIALAGSTGLFLLWLLDVTVYHRLLTAITVQMDGFEQTCGFPRVRQAMGRNLTTTLAGIEINARTRISFFYALPMLLLLLLRFYMFPIEDGHVTEVLGPIIGVWTIVMELLTVAVLTTHRREPAQPARQPA